MRVDCRRLLRDLAMDAAELLWPTRCVGCGAGETLLCDDCRLDLPWICQRWACPSCGAPYGWLCCTECRRDWLPRSCVCAMGFRDTAARIVTIFKDGHELRLAPVIAAALACALEEAAGWPAEDGLPRHDLKSLDGICFVPATAKAFARRGFDHMELVARELSQLTGLPVCDALLREQGADQRTLGRDERACNLEGRVSLAQDVASKRLLLIDDVATTGASLGACARALCEGGAPAPDTCAFARVW